MPIRYYARRPKFLDRPRAAQIATSCHRTEMNANRRRCLVGMHYVLPRWSAGGSRGGTGKVMVKRVPRPSSLCRLMLPP